MSKSKTSSPPAIKSNQRLQQLAARAQETDRLAQEADVETARLRKEMKRARKAYKEAKQVFKEAAKQAEKARTELSECLDASFRELAVALQSGSIPDARAKVSETAPLETHRAADGSASAAARGQPENQHDSVAASG